MFCIYFSSNNRNIFKNIRFNYSRVFVLFNYERKNLYSRYFHKFLLPFFRYVLIPKQHTIFQPCLRSLTLMRCDCENVNFNFSKTGIKRRNSNFVDPSILIYHFLIIQLSLMRTPECSKSLPPNYSTFLLNAHSIFDFLSSSQHTVGSRYKKVNNVQLQLLHE